MKFILMIFLLWASSILFCVQNNSKFVDNLDAKIVSMIELNSIFNKNISSRADIKGSSNFSNMLMDFTLELGNLRNKISSVQKEKEFSEIAIGQIIRVIRPDLVLLPLSLNIKKNEENSKYLSELEKVFKQKIITFRKWIIQEERSAITSGTLSKHFFNIHNHHFLYNLLNAFLSNAQLLSNENRGLLTQIMRAIHNDLLDESKVMKDYINSELKKDSNPSSPEK